MHVRYFCHAGQPTGYGRAAADLALALLRHGEELGITLEITPLGKDLAFTGPYVPLAQIVGSRGQEPDVYLVHTLPRDLEKVAVIGLGERQVIGRTPTVIGYTTWEGKTFPYPLQRELEGGTSAHGTAFDQIWLPSPVEGLFASLTRIVPHCYDDMMVLPERKTPDDAPYRFYWVGAWTERKNPVGLIRAYVHAFEKTDKVELLLHSDPPIDEYMKALASTGLEQKHLPTIVLSNRRVPDEAMWHLHVDSDCYVTATRGEAWDLPAFEATIAGRPVITPMTRAPFLPWNGWLRDVDAHLVPAHMGVTAEPVYQNPDHQLVGYRMVTTGPTGMTAKDEWYEPDIGHLAERMRSAYDRRLRHQVPRHPMGEAVTFADEFGYRAVAKLAHHHMKEACHG